MKMMTNFELLNLYDLQFILIEDIFGLFILSTLVVVLGMSSLYLFKITGKEIADWVSRGIITAAAAALRKIYLTIIELHKIKVIMELIMEEETMEIVEVDQVQVLKLE